MTLVVPEEFTIRIEMTSDWHVGSGAGRGEIDSEVQRDGDGLPYIPAKTLTGILRDGCEQVALALDGGNERGQWHRWVDFLFGDQPAIAQGAVEPEPRPAIVSIRSAHLDPKLRDALKARPKLKGAIAFIKPGVAIDEETGSAKPDFLRFDEVVRMGAVLTAQNCILNFSDTPNIRDDQKKAAYALLVAGAKMAERLGGKRRRGNGTCIITINADDPKTDEWIQWLKDNGDSVENPPEWKQEELTSKSDSNPATDTVWYTIPLTITTETPVVIPKRTVGNVVESLDSIPGRYFLRHLHRNLGKHLNVSAAIACGDLVITNATIAIDSEAGRPTPFCLFGEKLDGGLSKGKKVYNRFQEPEPDGIQLKGERSGYVGKFDNAHLPIYTTVSLELFTHNTIQDEVQRPTTDVGGVYSYQAIPAGTNLIAELRLPESLKTQLDQQSSNWWNDLAGTLRIGQSKKDQYGSVKIATHKPDKFSLKQIDECQLLYVWFLSDVLLRDKRLNPTTNPDDFARELERQLGLDEGALVERTSDDLLSCMMRSRRTESWQVRWGLPRPSMLGWQAGSCVVYEVKGEINPERLSALEAKGIGDRRAEGYGQICFNDPLLMSTLSHLKREATGSQPNVPQLQPIAQSDPSFEYARVIEKAAWRAAIENKALAIAANEQQREAVLGIKISREQGQESKSQPPMSQLGGLRSAMQRLTQRENPNSVTRWVDAINQVQNRKEKWPAESLQTIKTLASDFNVVWQVMGDFDDLTITQNAETRLQADLWAEAVRTLVDAIIRAHKRDLEKAQDNQSENGEAA
ncbi:MAG: hypothetical protein IGS50_04065 [Synechococcales cyanobacterium C42_A2020_086]|jgi:CRISPR-associated protein Csx10|nr:hypothetical protein [Synechococcales cyanobacterium C42_A2020_086]